MHVVSAVTQVSAPGVEVTVYSVMSEPPSVDGSVHEIVIDPSSMESISTFNGAPGTEIGTAAAEAEEAEPMPETFVAVTVNV